EPLTPDAPGATTGVQSTEPVRTDASRPAKRSKTTAPTPAAAPTANPVHFRRSSWWTVSIWSRKARHCPADVPFVHAPPRLARSPFASEAALCEARSNDSPSPTATAAAPARPTPTARGGVHQVG